MAPRAASTGGRAPLTKRRVLFEDADLVVVDKPPGLVAHATVDPARDHLLAAVRRTIFSPDEGQHLTLCHRLDRGTSGVTVLSKRPECDRPLADAFAQRAVHKTYLAIVEANPSLELDGPKEVRLHLAPDKGPQGRTAVVRSGGQPSHTRVSRIAWASGLELLELHPTTGRTHQIRVHLAHLGVPILGDALYGGAAAKRMMLHAWRLELRHPTTGDRMEFEAPWPRAFRARFPIEHAGVGRSGPNA